jgi:hypothetical protein
MWWWTTGALAAPCAVAVVDGRVPDAGLAFTPRTATLTDAAASGIDALACLLAQDPALRLHVEVHTDATGADTYNLAVSQRRADAIREALLARGVDASRVAASGCGEAAPIAPNTTLEGRARNSRIELWAPAPPDRPACPTVEVPAVAPAPVPAPPPPPPPAPRLPADCAAWTALTLAAPPTWRGVSCEAGAEGWTCATPLAPEVVVAAASACLPGRWDGPQWLAAGTGWALVVAPGPGGGATLGAR